MTTNNKYAIKDQIGRDQFKQFCSNQNQPWCKYVADATDPYSIWDTAYLSGHTSNFNKVKVIGEIKYRKAYNSSTYKEWILEVDKLTALQNKRKENLAIGKDLRLTYINIYANNYTRIWDISDLNINDYEVKLMLLPKNDFDDTLIYKRVIYLHNIDSDIYQTIDDTVDNRNNDNDEDLPF